MTNRRGVNWIDLTNPQEVDPRPMPKTQKPKLPPPPFTKGPWRLTNIEHPCGLMVRDGADQPVAFATKVDDARLISYGPTMFDLLETALKVGAFPRVFEVEVERTLDRIRGWRS